MTVNVENVLRVADAIEQHSIPDLGFNMYSTRASSVRDLSGHNCNTTACIAGYAGELFPDDTSPAMHSTFNLPVEVWRALVMPRDWRRPDNGYTSTQAVAVLRHLAATGEVDWSVADSLPNQGTDR